MAHTPVLDLRGALLPVKASWNNDVVVSFTFTSSSGAAQDMTGTWTGGVYSAKNSTSRAQSFTVDESDEATGVIVTTLSSTQALALFAGSTASLWEGWYDLVRATTAGTRTWVEGPFSFERNRSA